ncbi:MAG: hypothetical protein JW715_00035 [Sedimentisphaerales bacterium]|nr:hypothetical protein [Sedimentisphaerales bacterium]
MSSKRKIEKFIKNAAVHSDFQMNQKVLEELLEELPGTRQKQSAQIRPNIWRIIMKSPVTKIAAAAVIIIVCFAGLHFWNSTGSGVALADVLTRLEQVTAYTYQMQSRMTIQKTTSEWKSILLVSRENGIKIITKTADPNSDEIHTGESYLLPRQHSIVYINHEGKTYDRIKYEGREIDYYKDEYNDPHIIIKQILACDHVSLGQSVMDGVTVEGFRTTDTSYKGGFFGQADYVQDYKTVNVKLWVDVKTFLPVKLEEDLTSETKHIHETSYDFHWNVIVNADDFVPSIPDDYTTALGDFIIPANNEETAVRGLRLFKDLAGNYPASLEKDSLAGQARKLINFEGPDSLKGLSDEEKTRKTSELISLIMPEDFYAELVEKNKEPAYYGEKVGPGDSGKVLLRWKLDDGQYRVIFGDLNAKTVTIEELTELENR